MDKILPEALTMGVGYDEFWYFTPKDLQPFVKAFSLKQKAMDEQLWLQGHYIQLAVASIMSDKTKYPKEPLNKKRYGDNTAQFDIRQKFLGRMEQLNTRFKG